MKIPTTETALKISNKAQPFIYLEKQKGVTFRWKVRFTLCLVRPVHHQGSEPPEGCRDLVLVNVRGEAAHKHLPGEPLPVPVVVGAGAGALPHRAVVSGPGHPALATHLLAQTCGY